MSAQEEEDFFISRNYHEDSASIAETIVEEMDGEYALPLAYEIERAMYGIAIVLGCAASLYTIRKFRRCYRENLNVAARLLSYKISLSVADTLILFVYAPTQFVWITTYWWYGGEMLCRLYKFTTTFAFHLTGNMQVLIAFDRLIAMTRISKPRIEATTEYNSRLFLFLSWITAFTFSLPQLFIFKIVYFYDQDPQCSSIWNEYTYLLNREAEEYDTANAQTNESFHNSSLSEQWTHMQEWQKKMRLGRDTVRSIMDKLVKISFTIYNMVHISTICVIPYLLELILYALILAFLSDAQKGEFSGFRGFIRKKVVKFCNIKRKDIKELHNSARGVVVEVSCSDSVAQLHKKRTRRHSKSANSSPTQNPRVDVLYRGKSAGSRTRCLTMPLHIQKKTPLDSNANEIDHRQKIVMLSRRASFQFGANSLPGSPRTPPPWVKTVMAARRSTRRKAFLMLSCNLLLWLPYCGHAIISSLVDINFVNFQFASALVVFNAITNILL